MEWNAKWDWENLDIFSSKAIISPKKLQSTTDWGMDEGDGDVDGSFNLSGVVGGSGGSGSDLGNNSSAKSSVSASTESSLKEGMRVSNFAFEGFGGFPGASYGNKKDLVGSDMNGTSPPFEASVCSGEPFIGLKLGKRTYFENNLAKSSNTKTSFSEIPVSSVSTTAAKKVKSSCQSVTNPRCQVEGCNLDLSSAKEYHRKHRVCENHSKCPKVIVAGLERRFCQQCSRFHGLSEFDEKKRSCRRRLSDHNARRRKPQQETIQFNSTSLSSSFYDGRQQLSFVLNNVPVVQTRPAANSAWESTCSSKYTLGKVKAEKGGGDLDGMPHYAGLPVPSGISSPTHAFNKLLPSKGTRAEVFDQGFKESLSSEVDALDIRRALSLLSNNSWGSCEPDFVTLDHPVQANNNNNLSQNTMQPIPQGVPLPSPDYWQLDQQAIDPRFHALAAKASTGNNHFQEYQLFKAPYDARFYSDPLD